MEIRKFTKRYPLKSFVLGRMGSGQHLKTVACMSCLLALSGPLANAAENVKNRGATPQTVPVQIIMPDPMAIEVGPDAALSLEVMYDTLPQDDTLTGIGVRVHYDSSKLTFDQVSETLAFGRLFNPDLVAPEPDDSDFDGDPNTDRFLSMAWVDFGGNWPGVLPEKLARVHFTTAADFSGSTSIAFSASDLAAGHEFSSTPAIAGQHIIFADGFE
jgi:hypothetical protein